MLTAIITILLIFFAVVFYPTTSMASFWIMVGPVNGSTF